MPSPGPLQPMQSEPPYIECTRCSVLWRRADGFDCWNCGKSDSTLFRTSMGSGFPGVSLKELYTAARGESKVKAA